MIALADVFGDQQWFFEHAGRQYCIRPGWAVRHCRGAYLRVPASLPAGYPNTEAAAEAAWWAAAWPDLTAAQRAKLAKAARGRRGGAQ